MKIKIVIIINIKVYIYENKNSNNNKYQSLYGNNVDIHTTTGDIVDLILKGAMLRQSYDNVTCLLISFKNLLNTDFCFLDKNALNNNSNINSRVRDKYPTQKKETKNLVYSNSNNDYLRNNNLNNKKNINIHEVVLIRLFLKKRRN